jgi:DNA-binding protein H-NS
MSSYSDLKAKAEKLLAEAEEVRKTEVASVIAEIQEKMTLYGITTQDLNKGGSRNRQANTRIKYRGPEGQGWVGGRGRKPDWILAALKAGKDIKQFEV